MTVWSVCVSVKGRLPVYVCVGVWVCVCVCGFTVQDTRQTGPEGRINEQQAQGKTNRRTDRRWKQPAQQEQRQGCVTWEQLSRRKNGGKQDRKSATEQIAGMRGKPHNCDTTCKDMTKQQGTDKGKAHPYTLQQRSPSWSSESAKIASS